MLWNATFFEIRDSSIFFSSEKRCLIPRKWYPRVRFDGNFHIFAFKNFHVKFKAKMEKMFMRGVLQKITTISRNLNMNSNWQLISWLINVFTRLLSIIIKLSLLWTHSLPSKQPLKCLNIPLLYYTVSIKSYIMLLPNSSLNSL